jgi:phage shock protein A
MATLKAFGPFQKIKMILNGKLDNLINSLSDPEDVIPQISKELRDCEAAAEEKYAQAEARRRQILAQIQVSEKEIQKLTDAATRAAMKDDEELGRQILEKRQNAKTALAEQQSKMAMAEGVVQQAKSELTQLRAYIFEFESKKDQLIDRARQAKTQSRVNKSFRTALGKGQSVMDFINTMEKKVTEKEVLAEVQGAPLLGVARDAALDQQITALPAEDNEDLVDDEWAAIKKLAATKKKAVAKKKASRGK